MNVIDKDGGYTSKFKSIKENHSYFHWEKAEINQGLFKVDSVLKGLIRTEVIYVNVKCKETLYNL